MPKHQLAYNRLKIASIQEPYMVLFYLIVFNGCSADFANPKSHILILLFSNIKIFLVLNLDAILNYA